MARLVDVSAKDIVRRTATAEGHLELRSETLRAVSDGTVLKGDVISASKIAGIQAAKATSALLPLCHQIPLTSVSLDIAVERGRLKARCTVSADYRTGVEMEALVGVTAALLNAWDMVKYLEKDEDGQYPHTAMRDVVVVRKVKEGGKNGS